MPDKMSIAELASAIKRRDPRLQGVADDVLVRKVLERRPEMINMIYTAQERPHHDLLHRVSSRIGQDVNPINTADYVTSLIKAIRNPPYPKGGGLGAIGQSLKSTYSDPANSIGDVLAAMLTGKVAGEFFSRAGSPAPKKVGTMEVLPPAIESAVDMATRRAPGVPIGERSQILQGQLDSLRMQLKQQLAAKDPAYWNTRNKLQDVEAQYKSLFGSGPSTPTMTKGGAGINYTADQLADFKKKWGIQ